MVRICHPKMHFWFMNLLDRFRCQDTATTIVQQVYWCNIFPLCSSCFYCVVGLVLVYPCSSLVFLLLHVCSPFNASLPLPIKTNFFFLLNYVFFWPFNLAWENSWWWMVFWQDMQNCSDNQQEESSAWTRFKPILNY